MHTAKDQRRKHKPSTQQLPNFKKWQLPLGEISNFILHDQDVRFPSILCPLPLLVWLSSADTTVVHIYLKIKSVLRKWHIRPSGASTKICIKTDQWKQKKKAIFVIFQNPIVSVMNLQKHTKPALMQWLVFQVNSGKRRLTFPSAVTYICWHGSDVSPFRPSMENWRCGEQQQGYISEAQMKVGFKAACRCAATAGSLNHPACINWFFTWCWLGLRSAQISFLQAARTNTLNFLCTLSKLWKH